MVFVPVIPVQVPVQYYTGIKNCSKNKFLFDLTKLGFNVKKNIELPVPGTEFMCWSPVPVPVDLFTGAGSSISIADARHRSGLHKKYLQQKKTIVAVIYFANLSIPIIRVVKSP